MNRFTIENKNKFSKYFLEPLARLNPKCVLKIEKDKIQAKTNYTDGSLFLEASSSIDTDVTDVMELAFVDLTRFIKTLDFIQKDVVSFNMDKNVLTYKDNSNHFILHTYDPKVVPKSRISFEKINKLNFDLNLDFATNVFFEIFKAGGIYPDLNKLYFNFKDNILKIELSDHTKTNCDGFTRTVENLNCDGSSFNFILPLDAFRIILANKIDKLQFRFEKNSSIVNVVYENDGINVSYVIPCLTK